MATTLTQAREDFIAFKTREAKLGSTYPMRLRAAVKRFCGLTGVRHVEDILRIHVNRFEESHTEGNYAQTLRSAVRLFLAFCKQRYCTTVPQLATKSPHPANPMRVLNRGTKLAKLNRDMSQVDAVAAKMLLPHQRAIFLLGYLYGYNMKQVVAMSADGLRALPFVRQDLYAALTAIPAMGPPSQVFKPWLGSTAATASRRWQEWVAPLGTDFRTVVFAGQAARLAAGMNPQCGRTVVRAIVDTLPGLSAEGFERMRKFW